MSNPLDSPQFRKLLESARLMQARLLFLPSVAVGGTAAALYARHRVSLDVDFVSEALYAGLSAAGPLTAFAEAAHDDPADAAAVDLGNWRLLDPAYANLPDVLRCVREFALRVIEAAARK